MQYALQKGLDTMANSYSEPANTAALPMEAPPPENTFTIHFKNGVTRSDYLIDLVPEDAQYDDNDDGNATRFLDIYKRFVRYCDAEKRWYVFDGVCWKPDDSKMVQKMARDAMYVSYTKEIMRLEEADGPKDFTRIQQLYKKRDKSGNFASIQNCLNMAAMEVPIAPDAFDADPYWFHTLNGSLQLSRTSSDYFSYLYHNEEQFFTKTARANLQLGDEPQYPEGYPEVFALCPNWIQFVLQCCNEDMRLYLYLQTAAGYSILTGDISEQKVFCLLGEGRNGKSLFINTLAEIAGDYAAKIEASILCTNRYGDKDSDMSKELYRIKGSRFVYSNEFSSTSTLNETFIKTITDGGKISCRPLYSAGIEYKPTYTLWFSTNHMPNLRAMDEGIRRRVVVIPFRHHVPEQEVDRTLPDKFRAEADAILTWLIQGYDMYRAHGFIVPQAIIDATAGYFTEQDIFKTFVDEHYVVDEHGKIYAQTVYNDYRNWCEMNGEKYVSQTVFGKELQRLGIARERDRSGYYYTLTIRQQ